MAIVGCAGPKLSAAERDFLAAAKPWGRIGFKYRSRDGNPRPETVNVGDLAVRYFYVGLIVIFIRGIVTEIITALMLRRQSTITEPTDETPETPEDEPSEVNA